MMPEFYVLAEPWAVYVKEAAFFEAQGGAIQPWGRRWERVTAKDLEEARAFGASLRTRRKPEGWMKTRKELVQAWRDEANDDDEAATKATSAGHPDKARARRHEASAKRRCAAQLEEIEAQPNALLDAARRLVSASTAYELREGQAIDGDDDFSAVMNALRDLSLIVMKAEGMTAQQTMDTLVHGKR